MKRAILTSIFLFAAIILFGQTTRHTPQKMSYQAVVRNPSNELLTLQDVGVLIKIRKDNVEGPIVYTETHNAKTNVNGLLSLEIGTGVTADDFSIIPWHSGKMYVQTEIDMEGGTNYTIRGISQLMTVPYAFHSETAAKAYDVDLDGTEAVFLGWDKDASDDFDGEFLSLLNLPEGLADGDDVLTEEEVLAFVDGDGYMKTVPENYINGTMIAMGEDAPGDIMYYDGTNYVRLPKGNEDECLKINSSGLPQWIADIDLPPMGVEKIGFHLVTDGTNALWMKPEISGDMIVMDDNDAKGDIMYHDGDKYMRLGKGNNGQVLKLHEDVPSWKDDETGSGLPPVVAEDAGKFLITDGTNSNWVDHAEHLHVPSMGTHDGKYLKTDGTIAEWVVPIINGEMIVMSDDAVGDIMYFNNGKYNRLPAIEDGKVLKLDNGLPSWKDDETGTGLPPVVAEDAGKVLITDGTNANWEEHGEKLHVPTMAVEHAGKFLITDGTNANWEEHGEKLHVPTMAVEHAGKYLKTDGTNAEWVVPEINGEMIAMSEDANGDIMYYNEGKYVRLGADGDGKVLKLSGGFPTWITETKELPDMTPHNGKYLTTNGTEASWAAVTVGENSVDGSKIAMGGDTDGDILYYKNGDYVRLEKGNDDEVLVVNGSEVAWKNISDIPRTKYKSVTYWGGLIHHIDPETFCGLNASNQKTNSMSEMNDYAEYCMMANTSGSLLNIRIKMNDRPSADNADEGGLGSTTIKLYKNFNTTAIETQTVTLTNLNEVSSVDFTSNSFVPGDILIIGISHSKAPDGNTTSISMSLRWELDELVP